MGETLDLFGRAEEPRYPLRPGARHVDTSMDAADQMEKRAPLLRDACLQMLQRCSGGLTADEIADRLVVSPLSIRPRLSELKRMGRVKDSGVRRRNRSGKNAAVMILTIKEG